MLSHFRLLATPWTLARQAPLSMGSSRREYWSGLPCPPPGHLPTPGIKPASLTSPALAGGFLTIRATREALSNPGKPFITAKEHNHHLKQNIRFPFYVTDNLLSVLFLDSYITFQITNSQMTDILVVLSYLKNELISIFS